MTEWLRQSTSVTVMMGPFLDATTANTDQTTLTITQPDIRISKNGGAWAQKAAAQTLTHAEAGWYGVTLDATDTNTLGSLKVAIHESPSLNVWDSFMVVTANVWDSLFGSALQDVNVVNAAGTAWNSGAIGAATLAADTLTAAKVAADVSTEFATTFFGTAIPGAFGAGTAGSRLGKLPDVTAGAAGGVFIAGTNAATAVTTSFTTTFTGNLTGSAASVTGAVGSVTGSVGSVTGAVGSVTGAVGSVTGAVASVTGNVGGNVTGSVGSVAAGGITNASFATDAISASKVNADVGAEYASAFFSTAIPGAFGAGTAGSRLGKLPDVTSGAAGGLFIAGTNAATTITTGLTTTFTGNLTGSVGSVTGAVGSVTGSVGSVTGAVGSVTGAVGSVTGLTASNLDTTVSSRLATAGYTAPPSAASNATAVWTEALPGSYTSGQAGYKLNAAGSGADPWATTLPGAYGATTAGGIIGSIPQRNTILRSGTSTSGSANEWQFYLDAGASSTNGFYIGCILRLTSGLGAGQDRVIDSYDGTTKSCGFVASLLGTLPDSSTQFVIIPNDASHFGLPASTISWAVWDWQVPGTHGVGSAGYKLDAAGSSGDPWATALPGAYGAGTAGSRIGRVPDIAAGASNGLFIAGTNAAVTITTGLTTTFTGNLTGSVGSVTGAVGSVTGAVGSVTGLTASNLDTTISSRASQASVTTVDDFLDTEISAIQTAVTTTIPGTITTLQSSINTIDDFLDTEISTINTAVSTTIPGTITTLQADTDNIQTRIPAALVSGRIDASVGAVATDAIDANALAASAVDEILDEVVEGTTTFRQMLRLFTAALGNKVAGADTTTITFRDIADTKNRISATVDSSGNRTAITLDLT